METLKNQKDFLRARNSNEFLSTVKGFNDYIGEEAEKRREIIRIIEDVFRLYGFQPAETPVIEYEEFVKQENDQDEALSDIFRLTDVAALIKNMGDVTKQNDPMIHFYETFLAEYDPKLRKKRGVWYTPVPVVNFIVRAVDDILKTEFNLPEGLADNSKTEIEIDVQQNNKNRY